MIVASVATKREKEAYLANRRGEERGDYVEFSNGRRGVSMTGAKRKGLDTRRRQQLPLRSIFNQTRYQYLLVDGGGIHSSQMFAQDKNPDSRQSITCH